MIARIDHKNKAKKVMRGNLSTMVGANVLTAALTTLTYSVITACAGSFLVMIGSQIASIAMAGNIIQMILRAVVTGIEAAVILCAYSLLVSSAAGAAEIGNTRYYLNIAKKGERPGISTIFDGYNDFTGILVLYAFKSLIVLLWSLPLAILGGIIGGVLLANGKFVTAIVFVVLFVIADAVVVEIKSLQFSMAQYIKADVVKIDARECVNRSKKMTRGHLLDLFLFDLSYIGWAILNMITLLVGLFYYAPYYRMTKAYVYEELKKSQLSVVPMDKGDIPLVMTPPTFSDEEYEKIKNRLMKELKVDSGQAGIIGRSGMYQGQQFDFEDNQTVIIGRDPSRCNIIISTGGEKVSGKHCSITFIRKRGEYEVIDYSSNGTLADGKKLPAGVPNSLRRGTVISLANEKNTFQLM